jgi:hypothetical protein
MYISGVVVCHPQKWHTLLLKCNKEDYLSLSRVPPQNRESPCADMHAMQIGDSRVVAGRVCLEPANCRVGGALVDVCSS